VSFSKGELLLATAFNHILMAKGLQSHYVIEKMPVHILPKVLPQLDSVCFPPPLPSSNGEAGKGAIHFKLYVFQALSWLLTQNVKQEAIPGICASRLEKRRVFTFITTKRI